MVTINKFKDAKSRTLDVRDGISKGVVVPLNHIGDMENYLLDREECIAWVNSIEEDSINYSQLATRFKLRHKNGNIPKNGGQIIKEFLTQSSCDLTKFNQNNTLRIRKKKRRLNIFNIEVLQIMLHAYDINKKYYTA